MKAMHLLQMYDMGFVDFEQTGIIESMSARQNEMEDYVRCMFGDEAKIEFGTMRTGKHYFYAYTEGGECPMGTDKDDIPNMKIHVEGNIYVWVYELEF